jgi:hypothetical protein
MTARVEPGCTCVSQDTDAAISGGLDTTVRVHYFNSTLEEVSERSARCSLFALSLRVFKRGAALLSSRRCWAATSCR